MADLVAGRYQVLGELGRGAMGVVWRAVDTVLNREVALKELRVPEGLDRSEAVDRFLTEARAAARLSHPSIVTVHDVFAEEDRVLMSMELLDGQTLADILAARGPLGPAARPVMTEVAAALATAHRAGIVHRDLKPDNIFWLSSGRVVVCDFGLARIGAGRGTQVGTVMGTAGYMAPEQLRGQEVGPAADVFAWGAVAYEVIAGRGAFGDPTREDFATLAYRITHEHPAPLTSPGDPALPAVVATSLAKDPTHRFADGDQLHRALTNPGTRHLHSGPSGQPVPLAPPVAPRVARPPRQRSSGNVAAIAAGVIVAVAAVVLAAVLVLGGGGGDTTDITSADVDAGAIADDPADGASSNGASVDTVERTVPPGALGATNRPILTGYVAVLASGLKGSADQDHAEQVGSSFPGAEVIDTDDYRNGDGKAPDHYPRGGVIAAVVPGFDSAAAVQSWCSANRPGQGCNERQLVPS